MLFWTIVRMSFKSLVAHKLRSFLAMLGIIIGVSAVISMLALGTGAQSQIMARIESMGTNKLVIRPGQSGSRGVASGSRQNLTLEDAKAIFAQVAEIEQISPVVRGNSQLKYANKNMRSNVMGTDLTYFSITNFEIDKGRIFYEGETLRNKRVAVIGSAIVESLFSGIDPLGKTLKVQGINFQIIGVLKSKGDQGWSNPDEQIIVPYTTAMKQLFGVQYLHEIDVQVQDGFDLTEVEEAITVVLRRKHKILPDQEADFNVRNQAEMIETASSVSNTFTLLLGGIASISLLVGGIGIMNIMLVTVTERTKEIGIRKAIGAKESDILNQFLIESILMSSVGGILGVTLGVSIAKGIEALTNFPTVIQLSSTIIALVFAVLIGVTFGYYPARRAALLHPIDALRYE